MAYQNIGKKNYQSDQLFREVQAKQKPQASQMFNQPVRHSEVHLSKFTVNQGQPMTEEAKQAAIRQQNTRKSSLPSTYYHSKIDTSQQKVYKNHETAGHQMKENLINKQSGKITKSHAKYFSQQNSPVSKQKIQLKQGLANSQSGTGMVQIVQANALTSAQNSIEYSNERNYVPPGFTGAHQYSAQQNTGNFGNISNNQSSIYSIEKQLEAKRAKNQSVASNHSQQHPQMQNTQQITKKKVLKQQYDDHFLNEHISDVTHMNNVTDYEISEDTIIQNGSNYQNVMSIPQVMQEKRYLQNQSQLQPYKKCEFQMNDMSQKNRSKMVHGQRSNTAMELQNQKQAYKKTKSNPKYPQQVDNLGAYNVKQAQNLMAGKAQKKAKAQKRPNSNMKNSMNLAAKPDEFMPMPSAGQNVNFDLNAQSKVSNSQSNSLQRQSAQTHMMSKPKAQNLQYQYEQYQRMQKIRQKTPSQPKRQQNPQSVIISQGNVLQYGGVHPQTNMVYKNGAKQNIISKSTSMKGISQGSMYNYEGQIENFQSIDNVLINNSSPFKSGTDNYDGSLYQIENHTIQQVPKQDSLSFSMKKQHFKERQKAMSIAGSTIQNHQIQLNQNQATAYYQQLEQSKGKMPGHHRQLSSSGLSQIHNHNNGQSSLLALPKDPREPQSSTTQILAFKQGGTKSTTSKSQKSSTSRLITNNQPWKNQNSNAMNAGNTDRVHHANQNFAENLNQVNTNSSNYGMVSNKSSLKNSKSSISAKRAAISSIRGPKLNTLQHSQSSLQQNPLQKSQNQQLYPYQTSSTKSGKMSQQTSKKSIQQPQNMSIAQIFQQKGLNYKGPSKLNNTNQQQKIKKMAANGVIMHPKGGVGGGLKVALTTSANTAVNTAQNSPKMMTNKHISYNGKQTAVSSSRRKTVAQSINNQGAPVSIDISTSGMGQSNKQMADKRPEQRRMSDHVNEQTNFIDGGTGSYSLQFQQKSMQKSSQGGGHYQNQPSNQPYLKEASSNPNVQVEMKRRYQGKSAQVSPRQMININEKHLKKSDKQKIMKKGHNMIDQMQRVQALNKQEEPKLTIDMDQINLPQEPLITEEEELELRQVASDINEKAFYGKILRTKQIIDECDKHEDDTHLKRLSPRSQEIAFVMKQVKVAFDSEGSAPETQITFYRIGKMLGRGAFGKVNLAMHKLVRKLVAIKSLNKECLTDEVQKQKLMKEVNLLLKLRHDNVVKIYETIETQKHIIIVMELCAGGDLLNYVRKRRRLKEPYAKKIFKQIISGLKYIHSKYVGHRDIKLDNILLDGKGQVKIADFGVSKQCQPGAKMREQCGTPAYIAPEILKNKNGYSFNVDLWSAGVVLYAMLYGTVPFKAASMDELHSLILRGMYTLKDDISDEARDMLRGLLEINPHKRLTIEQIFQHPWLADVDDNLQLFNDQEREMIKKEYTYNDPSRFNRNECEDPVDCFTEHHIDSVYNTMKNCSEKSIILAPFNSTQSEDLEVFKRNIKDMICEKNLVLRLSRLCREIDRQYEFNNNGQLDNGVYHKQINNSANDDEDGKETKRKKKKSDSQSSDDDESRFQVVQCDRSNGMAFLTEDYKEEKEDRHRNKALKGLLGNLSEAERQLIESTFGTNKEIQIDQYTVEKLEQFGYPNSYIQNALQSNEPNYLTAGYYLLQMDQNYC